MSSGITRRIDELGRIVIPKEIRKMLYIKEGDSLDISIDAENIVMKKFSTFSNFSKTLQKILEEVDKAFEIKMTVYDREKIIASTSEKIKEIEYTEEFDLILKDRKSVTISKTINDEIIQIVCKPLIILSDVVGIIVIEDIYDKEYVEKVTKFLNSIIENKFDIS